MAIATATALAIGALASGATSAYATRTAGKQNRRALDATERSDTRAAELEAARLAEERRALDVQLAEAKRKDEERLQFERDEAARKERIYQEAVGRDRERWQDYLRINEPHWRQGSGVLGSLYDIAGMGSAPAFQMPTQPAPGSTGVAYGGTGAPPNPGGGYQGRAPVSTTMPVGSSRRAFPTMPTPSPISPMSSLQSLMQLADLGGTSRMPVPARQMDLSRLMTAPTAY